MKVLICDLCKVEFNLQKDIDKKYQLKVKHNNYPEGWQIFWHKTEICALCIKEVLKYVKTKEKNNGA